MVKKNLFITHLTPVSIRSDLRQSLYEIHKLALINQTNKTWKQFVVGEKEINSECYFEVALDSSGSKQERNTRISKIFERQDVIDFIKDSYYIIKLDDDDIISPTVLEDLKKNDFDLYYDEYHTFYDISSGCITQQKRPWVASTCIHKTEHALAKINKGGSENFYLNSVLYSEHSQVWHRYYEDKHIVSSPKNRPIYLRILSPTSITSGAKKFPIYSVNDIDFSFYHSYLKKFGYWDKANINAFDQYLNSLKNAWVSFTKMQQKPVPKVNTWYKITDKIYAYSKRIRKIF